MKNEKFRIVWSVDPFAKPPRFQRSAATVIAELASHMPTEVLPIHVLAAGLPERVRKFATANLQKIRRRGQSNLIGIMGKKGVTTEPLHILGRKFSSLKGGITELLQFSSKVKADLIVLSTHAHSAPKRWVIGSFAETISNLSDIPLLIAPSNWAPSKGKRAVLFATDFSEESVAAFERLLVIAAKQGWEIALFNRIDYQFYPDYAFAFAAVGAYKDELAELIAYRRSQAEPLVEKARRVGVVVNVVIKSTRPLSVVDSIVKEIRKGYLFVALTSQSGLVGNALLGGTTRQLIRKSPIPVWVIHPIQSKTAHTRTFKKGKLTRPDLTSEESATFWD